ncbi:Uridylate kinase [Polystyrenella longa]|uniref:Uridylate kinase n=1 Tax=Polystyrenella longa TaxID=2528007 RepID=A0A518CSH5_9PLAN|nr:UMP kinase [Polystyrenella longa]QDU82182.1 Uridylate kinase [Polystyrenella longa]
MSETPEKTSVFNRALLKLSGESFCRSGESGISMTAVAALSQQLKRAYETGVQLAIVTGGGNILRGKEFSAFSKSINAPTAHYMGMLATVINGLALQDALENIGVPTRLQTAIRMEGVAEPFIRRRCVRHLEKGRVVILAAGTGSPFVTTDTAAALRAREIEADIVLKATKVDGIYSEDPMKNPHAVRYPSIKFQDVLSQNLQVMDAQAFHHCMEHKIPIIVFNYQKDGNLDRVLAGEKIGTRVVPNDEPASAS